MAQAAFDTLAFSKSLQIAGLNPKAADAISSGMANAQSHVITDAQLSAALARTEATLTLRMGAMIAGSMALTVAVLGALISLN